MNDQKVLLPPRHHRTGKEEPLVELGDGERDEEEEEEEEGEEDSLEDSPVAWRTCACAVADQFIVIGILNMYGIFFVELIAEFKSSKAETAWLGSLTLGLLKLFAPGCSMMIYRMGRRTTMVTGCLLCSVSLFSASFASSMRALFLLFSVVYGVGSCLVNTTAMTVPTTYFNKHRGIATGCVCAGSSIGTLLLAPTTQSLVSWAGWRHTWQIYSVLLLLLAFLNLWVHSLPPEQRSPVLDISKPGLLRTFVEDLKLWKDRVFVLWTIAISFVTFGYYIPGIHLVSYAQGVGVGAQESAYLLMGLGASTAVGRLASGKLVQYGFLNRLHLHQMTMILTSVGYMTLPALRTFSVLMGYVVCMGLVDGCYVVLLPILTCSMVDDKKAVLAWGFLAGTTAVTFTMGPPIAGLLVDRTGSYDVAFRVAGAPVMAGALLLFFMPWAQETAHPSQLLRVLSCEPDDLTGSRTSLTTNPSSHRHRKRQGMDSVTECIDSHFQGRAASGPPPPVSYSWVDHTDTPSSPRVPRVHFRSLPHNVTSGQYLEAQRLIEQVASEDRKAQEKEGSEDISSISLDGSSAAGSKLSLKLKSSSCPEQFDSRKEDRHMHTTTTIRSKGRLTRTGDPSPPRQRQSSMPNSHFTVSPDLVEWYVEDQAMISPSLRSRSPLAHPSSPRSPRPHPPALPSTSRPADQLDPNLTPDRPPVASPSSSSDSASAAAGPSRQLPPLPNQNEEELSPLLQMLRSDSEFAVRSAHASTGRSLQLPVGDQGRQDRETAVGVASDGDRLSVDSLLGPCERNESSILKLLFDDD